MQVIKDKDERILCFWNFSSIQVRGMVKRFNTKLLAGVAHIVLFYDPVVSITLSTLGLCFCLQNSSIMHLVCLDN